MHNVSCSLSTKYGSLLLNKRRLPGILVLISASQDEDHFESWGDGRVTCNIEVDLKVISAVEGGRN